MAVTANHLAFQNLIEDLCPWAVADARGDVEGFARNMIELENERVTFTTVNAWVMF